MNIVVKLSKEELKALKEYLKSVSSDVNPTISKKEIENEIRGMVSNNFQFGALGDYYKNA